MPRRWCLIPSGKAADDAALHAAVADLRRDGIAVDVRAAQGPGEAGRHVAAAIAERVETIVAAGGDGTLSMVAAALAHREEDAVALPALGVVPLGTANDFATAAGIPATPAEALALVRDRVAVPIDLLRLQANGAVHWAVNLASGGFGTQVTVETREGLKKLLGGLAYLVTAMGKLGRIDAIDARLHGPGFAWQGEFIALGVGNGRQAGGGQALCPDALVDDGLLDVTVIPELSGELGGTLATLLTNGREAALEQAGYRARLPWLAIERDAPFTLNLDGEPIEAARLRIDCVPGRLRMHLPAGCALLGAAAVPPTPDPL